MQDKDNTIALWVERDRKSDRHPHLKGRGMINGREVYASAWERDPDANPNAPALRIAITYKDEMTSREAPPQRQPKDYPQPAAQQHSYSQPASDFDDDIPF